MLRSNHSPRSDRRSGFTLIEILIVATIVGILAALAIPTFMGIVRNAAAGTLANDFRKYSEAFIHYNLTTGEWPADVNRAEVPPVMNGYFNEDGWTLATAIDGNWDYDAGQFGVTAAISINSHTASPQMVAKLDAIIDDGDPRSGRLQAPRPDYIIFILEE